MGIQTKSLKYLAVLFVAIISISALVIVSATSSLQPSQREMIYQISTYDSLNKGGYEGIVPLKDITKHGDFGIGTFEGINGEMVFVDNIIYQVTVDGKVHPKNGNNINRELTPYAVVTYFDTDIQKALANTENYATLQNLITNELPNKDNFYAVRIDGTFDYIKTRSVPAQTKPYPPLPEVVKQQATFEFTNIKGTLVGFWCPQYVGGVNVAGFHLHFLTSDRTAGGHALELKLKEGTLKIDNTAQFYFKLGNK
jgi:acetolactate decarboxylase